MRTLLLMLFGLIFILGQLMAQNRTISGKLSDQQGNPIPNASIMIKGLKSGTTTDANGDFKLLVSPSAKTLVLSSVNFICLSAFLISLYRFQFLSNSVLFEFAFQLLCIFQIRYSISPMLFRGLFFLRVSINLFRSIAE